MYNGPDGLNHGNRRFRLENVASHIHTGGALLHRVIGHGQGVQFGYLLAAGHYDGHRTGCGNSLKIFFDVVALDVMGAKLRANPASQPEVLGVAGHVLAYSGYGHGRECRNDCRYQPSASY